MVKIFLIKNLKQNKWKIKFKRGKRNYLPIHKIH